MRSGIWLRLREASAQNFMAGGRRTPRRPSIPTRTPAVRRHTVPFGRPPARTTMARVRSFFASLHDRFRPEWRLSRRDALKAALAAAAGGIAGCAAGPSPTDRPSGPRVCILGAGFAGLAAAWELARLGADVTVVEGRARIGGRVLTRRDLVPGKTVEAGGELIGLQHTAWIEYAATFGLDLRELEDDGAGPVQLDGRILTAGEQEALFEDLDAFLPGIDAAAAPVDADRPWLTPGAVELDARPVDRALEALPGAARARRAAAVLLETDMGAPAAEQSWLGLLAQVKGGGLEAYWRDSESLRCVGGNGSLARRLAEGIGEGRIRLSLPAVSVEQRERDLLVTLRDRTRIECDRVIVAVAPSVLGRIDFRPALPDVLGRAGMGRVVKFLAALSGPFWLDSGRSPNFASDGPVGVTWHGTSGQGGGAAGLVAFSGGRGADSCRAFGAAERVRRYLAALAPAYPGLNDAFTESLFMDWPADPWTQGGYSCAAPGEMARIGSAWRDGAGGVVFAGEHTCPAFQGYMEGALRSGRAAAAQVAAATGLGARRGG